MESTETSSHVPILHRSALKAPGSSKRFSPPPQVTSAGVHFNEAVNISEYSDPLYPTPQNPRSLVRKPKSKSSEEKTIKSTSQIPARGPVPPFTLPSAHSRDELEALSFQLASKLRFDRLAEEARARRRDEPPGLDRSPPKRKGRDEFPEFKKILMGPWVSGMHYGPILDPPSARAGAFMTLHPALAGPYSELKGIEWDILCDIEGVAFRSGTHNFLLDTFRHQPATAPRLDFLYIVSQDFSWRLSVLPLDISLGVTVHDILRFIASFFRSQLHDADPELDGISISFKESMERSKNERLVHNIGPPFICGADRLLGKRKLAGFVYDSAYIPVGQSDEDEIFIQLHLTY
ncbi:hypothetical protein CYLTODRAFT_422910 [Cylindrobasidium torrendii FP15055 ss-10]|uniref:DUF6699 domain-containing protein n=1 Tax=Cylindrobasidium torrendii FP15055 ss-10 TaxID=1314674 RepID=A0A0D7B951_9AGAR|nr:hypothetical protein CYLTODRAFT_422910 [Cylindrobasidium torrendii FP15055 ss-10]